MIGQRNLQVGGTFDLIPSGNYTLQNLGGIAEEGFYKGNKTISLCFTFAILDDNKFVGQDGKEQSTRGRQLRWYSSDYLTLKSKLFTFVGIVDPSVSKMTDEERKLYNLDSLEGCQINGLIGRGPSKTDPDKIYNNILSFEKCEKELAPVDNPNSVANIIHNSSVPVEAPAETATPVAVTAPVEPIKSESSADFVASLKKESEAAKQPTLTDETPAQKKVREANEAIAKIKADAGITE